MGFYNINHSQLGRKGRCFLLALVVTVRLNERNLTSDTQKVKILGYTYIYTYTYICELSN